MPIQRARPGSPLEIRAADWNRIADAAELIDRIAAAGFGESVASRSVVVTVHNTGETDIPAFGVAANDGPYIDPSTNVGRFISTPSLNVEPFASGNSGEMALIAKSKIPAGSMGKAVLSGLTVAKVNVTSASHEYAKPSTGTEWQLDSSADPTPIRIVGKESGTGTKWAYVLLAAEGGGGDSSVTFGIIQGNDDIPGSPFAFKYTCARIEGDTELATDNWVADEDDTFTAYNTAERIGFDSYTPLPIANGVAVIAFKGSGDDYYFSMSGIEGVCG